METYELLSAIECGIELDLNRQADLDAVKKRIDPDGFHVLRMLLPFHSAYRDLPHHHRVEVYMKVTGSMEPAVFMLDITDTHWQSAMPAASLVDF
jgi:hypothetical protein